MFFLFFVLAFNEKVMKIMNSRESLRGWARWWFGGGSGAVRARFGQGGGSGTMVRGWFGGGSGVVQAKVANKLQNVAKVAKTGCDESAFKK